MLLFFLLYCVQICLQTAGQTCLADPLLPLISLLGKILHGCSLRESPVSYFDLSVTSESVSKNIAKNISLFFRFHDSFACIVCVGGRKREIFPI